MSPVYLAHVNYQYHMFYILKTTSVKKMFIERGTRLPVTRTKQGKERLTGRQ